MNLQQRVEQIIDEGGGQTRSVLVRMRGTLDREAEPIREAAAYRIMQRGLALSSRDVLPESVDEAEPAKRKEREAQRYRLPQHLKGLSPGKIRTQSERAFRPLLKSVPVARHEERATRGEVSRFHAAEAMLLELDKDELVNLVEETEEIAEVYVNRELGLPRVVEAKHVPQSITESRAAAYGLNKIGALAVWGAFGVRGEGIKIGVLDTGVDASHPDLASKVDQWAQFNAEGHVVPDTHPHDTDRHGTHVCGTIVGGKESGQWIGVAPEAKVSVGLVLDGKRGGTDAQILAGIDWAIFKAKVHVLNLSLGGLAIGPDVPDIYTNSFFNCVRAGILPVTAVGNEGHQTSGSPGNDLFAYTVGATDDQDRVAGFSGGRTQLIRRADPNLIPPAYLPMPYSKPEICAPGVAVHSCVPDGEWAYLNGTSMATPHVAGAIALLLSATTIRGKVEKGRRAFFVQDLLTGTVEERGESGQDHRYGFGRLDILRAIGYAKQAGY